MAAHETDGTFATAAAGGLDETEVRTLAGHAELRSYPKHSVVINEGDRSDTIFVIRSGRVKVYLQGEGGKEVTLNVQGPGEYFGEMILDEGPRSASVVTLEASELYVVTKGEFRKFLAANPDFAMKLINRLMSRVRVLTESVGNLALLDVYGRVAHMLLEMAKEHDGMLAITEKLTHKGIADRVGSSREMVSRIFKDLVAGGYIRVDHGQIAILKDLPSHW